MQAYNITLIQGVAKPTLWEGIKDTLSANWGKIPDVGITPKILGNYDQGKNPYCTAYASAGCATYNTGTKYTELDNWASKYIQPNGLAGLSTIANKFALEHGLKCKAIDIATDGIKLAKAGYAIAISTIAPLGFIQECVTTGKYSPKIAKGGLMTHAMFLIWKDGWYIVNSWHNLTQKGLYNIFEVDLEYLLLVNYMRPQGHIIYLI